MIEPVHGTVCREGWSFFNGHCFPACDEAGGYATLPSGLNTVAAPTCVLPNMFNRPIRFLAGESQLSKVVRPATHTNTISLKFRTTSSCGLLMFVGPDGISVSQDSMFLLLAEGKLHYGYNLGAGHIVLSTATRSVIPRLDDGYWHTVTVFRDFLEATLTVDTFPPIQVKIDFLPSDPLNSSRSVTYLVLTTIS